MSKLKREKFLNKWVAQCSYNNDCHDCKDAPECGLAYLQVMEMIQKPEVTKEFIEKWAKALKGEVLVEMEWKNTLPINIFIAGMEEMLKDAGISVE